ncbi:coiled-coil domain-containing protein 12, partial [Serinus canaria]|uniref:coiled-coil domain-containing protein 12 n=1 Tax=Serinus canaria TaxID=9135 RepID=UPI0021CC72E8
IKGKKGILLWGFPDFYDFSSLIPKSFRIPKIPPKIPIPEDFGAVCSPGFPEKPKPDGLSHLFFQSKESGEPEPKIPREDEEEEPVKHREIKLRNYDPEDEELKKRKLPPAKPASVEDTVKEQLEAAKPEPIIDEVDLANLAPRKPDWDLKRDVSKKLEKLEKRTQRAIAELIRERLKGQEGELASAVGSAKQEGSDSD